MSNPPPPPGQGPPYGGPPPGDSNPYGSPYPSGDNNPYGSPYPGTPGGQPEQKNDGVSIASFITSLVCCAPVAVVLGIIGLRRTKDNQRKGRWAAITGLILGILGTLGLIGAGIFIAFVVSNTVTPGNAEVGQCVEIDTDDNEVSMMKKECDEEHDGEIVAVEEVDDDNRETIETTMQLYCDTIIDAADLETIRSNSDLELNAVIEDPDNVENGDHLVCYVESDDDLTEKILK